tara:strand:- start:150 stop:407 length:258 start_codon:yes stop_codon:yes gene_type:complete
MERKNLKNEIRITQTYLKQIFVFFIKCYQFFLSPILGSNCRYSPTCSEYAKQAIDKYGIVYGVLLSLKRILRCQPWGKSGYDPVD